MPSIAQRRLANQRLIGPGYPSITAAVGHLLAVQSQDYPAAKWGLAQRITGTSDLEFDAALAAGAILRTHVMRPTWHFVLPADLRWLQALTRHRVLALNAPYYRKQQLDAPAFSRLHSIVGKALEGGKALTRPEIGVVVEEAGIAADNFRLGLIMMHLELECLVVSGPVRGKQQTYVLVDEVVPPPPELARDEALAELAVRYFASHGPAKAHDLAWYSGLTLGDVRTAIVLAGGRLVEETIDGERFWSVPRIEGCRDKARPVHLLPNYDEYFIGYRDRSAIYPPGGLPADLPEEFFYRHVIAVNGMIVGQWRRDFVRKTVAITASALVPLNATMRDGLAEEAARYGAFIGLPVGLEVLAPE